jgi:hypothetical protein
MIENAGQFDKRQRGLFASVVPDTTPGKLVFNRTVPLRGTRAKIEKAQK